MQKIYDFIFEGSHCSPRELWGKKVRIVRNREQHISYYTAKSFLVECENGFTFLALKSKLIKDHGAKLDPTQSSINFNH